MLPDIGVMVAAYIITRMAALLGQPSPQANIVAKILAGLTIVITLIAAADLMLRGIATPSSLR